MDTLALQLHSVRDDAARDLRTTLIRVAKLGYTGVEFAGWHGHSPDELKSFVQEAGLNVVSAHLRPEDPSSVQDIVKFATALGHRQVVTLRGEADFQSLETVRALARELQTLALELIPHGIELLYHNHWWEMREATGRALLDHLMEQAPAVNLQLDLYWVSDFGRLNVPDFLRAHKDRLASVHVKDGTWINRPREPQVAVGRGRLDIPACIAAALESPRKPPFIVELDRCATDMWTAVEESVRFLQAL